MTRTPLEQELLAALEEALPLVIHAYRLHYAPTVMMKYTFHPTRPIEEAAVDIYKQAVAQFGEPPLVTQIRASLAKAKATD